jgi:hypothetical protein
VYQILKVHDEWNILKCTLDWRRIQNISITLAFLWNFWWFQFFTKLKFQQQIWRSRCPPILAKKFGKKWNLQGPWAMEDWTLPCVGASFKKWGCYTLIFPKYQAHFQTSPKKVKIYKKIAKKGAAHNLSNYGRCRRATSSCLPSPGPLFCTTATFFSNSSPSFWAHVVNSFSLAQAHARPTQTPPKIFKHP